MTLEPNCESAEVGEHKLGTSAHRVVVPDATHIDMANLPTKSLSSNGWRRAAVYCVTLCGASPAVRIRDKRHDCGITK